MDNIQEIITVVSSGVALAGTIIGLAVSLIKSVKGKKASEALNLITNAVRECVAKAEEFKNYTGSDKKEWVLTKVNQFCIDRKIKFDPIEVSEAIEATIKLTNEVNKREGK